MDYTYGPHYFSIEQCYHIILIYNFHQRNSEHFNYQETHLFSTYTGLHTSKNNT